MKKLSLEELKEKVTVLTDCQAKQSISGGESPAYWVGYYAHELWYWLTEE